jgi:4-hydroxybenzoate polyprenyltransferase
LVGANILIYGINDIFDYETDKLNPKKVAYESLVMPDEHKSIWKYTALTTIPFLFFLDINNFYSLIAFVLFIFCAVFYSAWPIRAKIRPILDMIFSAGHYNATGIFAFALLTSIFPNPLVILAGMLWAMAMHAYSAVPDIKADADSGIKTTATLLGKKPTILMCLIFYIISTIIASQYIGIFAFILLLPYIYLMLSSLNSNEERLFKLYTYFPKLNTIVGMIVFFLVCIYKM